MNAVIVEPATPLDLRVVTQHLRRLVVDAAALPPLFTPVVLCEVGPNVVAHLTLAVKPDPRLPVIDDVEAAILSLLCRRGRTRHRDIIAALISDYAEITIRRRLEGLLVAGLVRNNPHPPRGYDLASDYRAFIAGQERQERATA